MDRFLRPSGAAYFVVAVIFIGVLAGLPSWAAKNSATKPQGASAPAPAASKPHPPPPQGPSPPAPAASKAHAALPAASHGAAADSAVIQRGKQLYAQYCASCHGDAGKGDGPGGANLAVKPQDRRRSTGR